MLIFSSKHRLHLPLKLLAADECLNIFYLICGDSPWSFGGGGGGGGRGGGGPRSISIKQSRYLSFGLENEWSMAVPSLLPVSRGDPYIDSFPVPLPFHRRNACLVYDIPRGAGVRPKGHSSLFLQLQDSTFGFLSVVVSSLSSLLLWLLSIVCTCSWCRSS